MSNTYEASTDMTVDGLFILVDAGFVLALPFHHGDLEPDCVGLSTRGTYVRYLRKTLR